MSISDDELQELYTSGRSAARAASVPRSCPAPEAIEALVLRASAEEARLETLEHVMTCEMCRRDFELLRAIDAAARQADTETETDASADDGAHAPGVAPLDFNSALEARRAGAPVRRLPRWIPLAAAAILIGVGLPLAQRSRQSSAADTPRGTGPADAQGVRLASPGDRATAPSAPITLVWHPVRPGVRYIVELVSPDGQVVATQRTADTTAVLNLAPLPAGSYDWWVRLDGTEGAATHSGLRRLVLRSH